MTRIKRIKTDFLVPGSEVFFEVSIILSTDIDG